MLINRGLSCNVTLKGIYILLEVGEKLSRNWAKTIVPQVGEWTLPEVRAPPKENEQSTPTWERPGRWLKSAPSVTINISKTHYLQNIQIDKYQVELSLDLMSLRFFCFFLFIHEEHGSLGWLCFPCFAVHHDTQECNQDYYYSYPWWKLKVRYIIHIKDVLFGLQNYWILDVAKCLLIEFNCIPE